MMKRQRGFNLLEAGFVVAAMGIMLVTVMMSQQSGGESNAPAGESGMMDQILTGALNFAKKNNRLACPDVNGDGVEDCAAPSNVVGGVPFNTLGIDLPGAQGTGIARKFIYGVYRGSAAAGATDLAVTAERSKPVLDLPSAPTNYKNLDDFRQGIINAWKEAADSPTTNQIFVTGNDAGAGASSGCALVTNVALVIAYSGKDGVFQGAHSSLVYPSGGGVKCFVGPNKPVSLDYDDQVRAVSFPELLGALSR